MRKLDQAITLLTSATPGAANKLANEARDKIRQAIADGYLKPNQRLVESQIARELGMSRTPVREALKQLEVVGFVTTLTTGGVIVANYSPGQIRSMYEIREALETMGMRLACQRATEEQIEKAREYHNRSFEAIRNRDIDQFIELNNGFHGELLNCCGNEQLSSLVEILRNPFFDKRVAELLTDREWQDVINQHGRILEAVSRRKAHLAEQAVRQHVKTVLRVLMARL